MLVSELIEKLKEMPQDMLVVVESGADYYIIEKVWESGVDSAITSDLKRVTDQFVVIE